MLPAVFVVVLQGCSKIQRTHYSYEPELMKYKPLERACESPKLSGTVCSLDILYQSDKKPQQIPGTSWTATAWKAERVNGKFAVWSDTETKHARLLVTDMVSEDGHRIGSEHIRPYFQRYVLADNKPFADIIDTAAYIDIPERTIRPIWLMVDVPSDAAGGAYRGKLAVLANDGKEISFDLNLTVVDRVLPPPSQWKFWLDLWINPWAIARYHHVELWSDEHLQIMRPYLEMAADIGQNCLHLCIMDRTWGGHLFDTLSSMIKWTKNPDGTWTFDYTAFDRYLGQLLFLLRFRHR
jgi:hypothetical protein